MNNNTTFNKIKNILHQIFGWFNQWYEYATKYHLTILYTVVFGLILASKGISILICLLFIVTAPIILNKFIDFILC